jgi:hypothetical protein
VAAETGLAITVCHLPPGTSKSGTRGGVFHQKLSNRDRVLLAVLYQRRLCTMDVLADLLKVCRSSIGNAIRETRPLLEQAGHLHTGTNPLPHRHRPQRQTLAGRADGAPLGGGGDAECRAQLPADHGSC